MKISKRLRRKINKKIRYKMSEEYKEIKIDRCIKRILKNPDMVDVMLERYGLTKNDLIDRVKKHNELKK